MVFSSLSFLLYFLPIFLIIYFIMPTRLLKNSVLIVSSLIFYAWGEPVWVILMIISAVVDYSCGRIMDMLDESDRRRYFVLFISLVVNLGFLGYFKYRDFFISNVNSILSVNLPLKNIMIPIGISFYTFQTLSYTIDMFRGKAKVQKNFFDFLLYVSLFPQLVAGPIIRYVDVSNEIQNRNESWEDFSDGVHRFCMGLAKKVIIANTAGEIGVLYLDGDFSHLTVVGAWFGILLYALQIYFDFSGYSDMAIGMGRMMGFHFKENFNYPYVAKSVSEFWRRWHMSLVSFFRDYVYIPLGGNRNRLLLNMLIVWFLSGLWHGANWNFVIWGLYFCMFILIERLFIGKLLANLPSVLSHLYLILVVVYSMALFYFTDLNRMVDYSKILLGMSKAVLVDKATILYIQANIIFMIVALVISFGAYSWVITKFKEINFSDTILEMFKSILSVVLLIISIIMIVGQSYNPFLYFNF